MAGRPILTDSGGFQVSRCATHHRRRRRRVTFRSVYDGAAALHSRIGRGHSGPLARHRNVPRHLSARRRSARSSQRRFGARRSGSQSARCPAGQASFCSGSPRARPTASCADARSRRSPSSVWTVTRSAPRDRRRATTDVRDNGWAANELPADKPRTSWHRHPEGVLEVIERGVDMFDCVLPTRTARTGSALTWEAAESAHARFARDPRRWKRAAPARPALVQPRLSAHLSTRRATGLRLLSSTIYDSSLT